MKKETRRCSKNARHFCYSSSVLLVLAGSVLLFPSATQAEELTTPVKSYLNSQAAETPADSTGVWGDISWEFDADTKTLRFTSAGTIPQRTKGAEDRTWMNATNAGEDISKIVFEQEVTAPADATELFGSIHHLRTIDGAEKIDVSAVTNMTSMFTNCYDLDTLSGLSSWDVSSVTTMNSMFYSCNGVDLTFLSSWDVSKVTDISRMLQYVDLTDLSVLSDWNVSNVKYMDHLFESNQLLTDLSPLSSWNVSNVVSMIGMFQICPSLSDIESLSSWDTGNVAYFQEMFSYCSELTDLSPLSDWDVSSALSMKEMFMDCTSLTTLSGLSSWDISNVQGIGAMFMGDTALTDISALTSWNVGSVVQAYQVFSGCSALRDLSPLEEWNVSGMEILTGMFEGCSSLETADSLINWPVSSHASLREMFKDCVNLKSVGMSAWDMQGVGIPYFVNMFEGCANLSSITTGSSSYWVPDASRAESEPGSGLPAIDTSSGEYTGEWIGLSTGNVYASSDAFIGGYDGTIPDTYVWRKATASAHYDANGGDAASLPSDETIPFRLNADITLNVSSTLPTRAGTDQVSYECTGWNTAADGSGVSYLAGDVLTFDSACTTTLYAQWREIPIALDTVGAVTPGNSASSLPDSGNNPPIQTSSGVQVLSNQTVTRNTVLPATGEKSSATAGLSGALALLAAGTVVTAQMKRRKN